MLDAGAYCAIASHDYPVVNHALSALESHKMGPGIEDPRSNAGPQRNGKGPGYEFQMLLGVRGPLRENWPNKGIEPVYTYHTGKNGMNTAFVDCKKIPQLVFKLSRHF